MITDINICMEMLCSECSTIFCYDTFFVVCQAQLDEQLAGLQTLTAARRSKLEESIKLHQYLQDVEEVLSWLSDKEKIASSDDFGKDFEHLLVRWQCSETL